MRNLDLREKVRQKVVPGALLVAWICVASYTVSALLAMSGAWDAARARPSSGASVSDVRPDGRVLRVAL